MRLPIKIDELKNKLPAILWYRYFYKPDKPTKFNMVKLPKVNKKFS